MPGLPTLACTQAGAQRGGGEGVASIIPSLPLQGLAASAMAGATPQQGTDRGGKAATPQGKQP